MKKILKRIRKIFKDKLVKFPSTRNLYKFLNQSNFKKFEYGKKWKKPFVDFLINQKKLVFNTNQDDYYHLDSHDIELKRFLIIDMGKNEIFFEEIFKDLENGEIEKTEENEKIKF